MIVQFTCENCGEVYSAKLLNSETVDHTVYRICPVCGFENEETLFSEEDV